MDVIDVRVHIYLVHGIGGSSKRRTVSWRGGTEARRRRVGYATQLRMDVGSGDEGRGGEGGGSRTHTAVDDCKKWIILVIGWQGYRQSIDPTSP